MGVIARLKNPPKRIKVEGSMDLEHSQPDMRKWVRITYDFQGKLGRIGGFLERVTEDVFQAGGYVTAITFPTMAPLSPANERPDDYTPRGKWRAMFVDFALRTQVECEESQAAWDAGVQEIINRCRRETAEASKNKK